MMTDWERGREKKHRIAMCLLFISLSIMWVLSRPLLWAAHPTAIVARERDEYGTTHGLAELTELDHRCANAVTQALPITVVGAPLLAVDQVSVHVEPNLFTIFIPLKTPQRPMTHVFLSGRTFDGAVQLIRVIQSPALKSVRWWRSHRNAPPR